MSIGFVSNPLLLFWCVSRKYSVYIISAHTCIYIYIWIYSYIYIYPSNPNLKIFSNFRIRPKKKHFNASEVTSRAWRLRPLRAQVPSSLNVVQPTYQPQVKPLVFVGGTRSKLTHPSPVSNLDWNFGWWIATSTSSNKTKPLKKY